MKEAIALCRIKAGSERSYLFNAPAYQLKKGDEVDVQTQYGIKRAEVINVLNYATDEAKQFVLDMEQIEAITGYVVARYRKEEFTNYE